MENVRLLDPGLGAAIRADSVQLHLMAGQRHPEIARHDILHPLDRRVLELDNPPASLADKMIVMPFADRLLARLTLVEVPLVQKRALL